MNTRSVHIFSTGSYVPESCLNNEELAKGLKVSPAWIKKRTGIEERRIAAPNQATSDLALAAAKRALDAAKMDPQEIDLIVLATSTPDTILPSTACRVQQALTKRQIPAFDLSASCSGFLYGLNMGVNYIKAGQGETVLVIGAEVRSRFTDYEDVDTAILYGDGAGAVILKASKNEERGIIDCKLGADGKGADSIEIPGGGSRFPTTTETMAKRMHFVKLKKIPLIRAAVNKLIEIIDTQLKDNNLSVSDLKVIIPHQMNERIIDLVAKGLNIFQKNFYLNLDKVGNTSAASIPLAFDEAIRNKIITKNDLVMLVSFGGGFTWGTTLLYI